jgi:hypothetical protein
MYYNQVWIRDETMLIFVEIKYCQESGHPPKKSQNTPLRILSYLLFDQGSEDDHDLNKSKHFHTTKGGKSIRHRIAMCVIIWLLYYTFSGHTVYRHTVQSKCIHY